MICFFRMHTNVTTTTIYILSILFIQDIVMDTKLTIIFYIQNIILMYISYMINAANVFMIIITFCYAIATMTQICCVYI